MVRLEGRIFGPLLPLLDGRNTVDDIVRAARPALDPAETHFALAELEARGCLAEARDLEALDRNVAAYWHAVGQGADVVRARLAAGAVDVVGLGGVASDGLTALLAAEGLTVTAGAWPKVVLVDDYLHDGLAEINRAARAGGHSWLLARPVGAATWLGPWFGDPGAACWLCLAHRLRGYRAIERLVARVHGGSLYRASCGATPATRAASDGLLAAMIVRSVVSATRTGGRLTVLDPGGIGLEEHRVVRRPQCEVCGDPTIVAAWQAHPLALESRPKAFTADGGHRTVSPEQTWIDYRHHVSAISGVVHTLEQIYGARDEIAPIFDAGYNVARQGESLWDVKQIFRARSGGKGATVAQARASGLCEALERYSAVFQGDEHRRRASFAELGEAAVHPHSHLLFSERQYQERAVRNAAQRKRSYTIPERFDEERPVDWSPAWSLTHGHPRHVATAFCYYGYPHPHQPHFCWADSNGNASGNVLEEAVLQGFLEVVERDSVAIWWYNRLRRPRVDLASFDEPHFARLEEHYRRLGRELWVLDVSADLEVPVFAAVSRRPGASVEQLTVGFGAHLDPRIGILRALTEMNQFLPFLAEDGQAIVSDEDVRQWLLSAHLEEHPHLAPSDAPARRRSDYTTHVTGDLRDDVQGCVDLARRQGIEVLVHVQTRPDVGLPVVKVIAPGLRHFWPRFGPGRLYDVPVRLGWRSEPCPEQLLNPIPVFF